MTVFQKAQRYQRFARVALYAGSGHGKTMTALHWATQMANMTGGRVAFVDTEKGSASLYATEPGQPPQNEFEFDFDMFEFEKPYTTGELIKIIKDAEQSPEHTVLVIDSLSPFWDQEGGVLYQADLLKKSTYRGDGFRAIAHAKREYYHPLVEAIIDAKIHLICTMRAKNEYDISRNERGKTQISRIGTAPRMEEGFIYEMDFVCVASEGVNIRVDKTRYAEYDGKIVTKPKGDWIAPYVTWLSGPEAQANPYTYGDGAEVASTQAKRIFNEYREGHGGAVPATADVLKEWYANQKEAAE